MSTFPSPQVQAAFSLFGDGVKALDVEAEFTKLDKARDRPAVTVRYCPLLSVTVRY